MTFYKIRHIPTGLFYKPSKYNSRSNLSKQGKVYQRKPTFKYLGKKYYHPNPQTLQEWKDARQHAKEVNLTWMEWYYPDTVSSPVDLSEWEIVEFAVIEVSRDVG